MGLALGNATNNVVNVDAAGGITISSIISGSGRNLTKAGAGTGTLTLSGTNTYTGVTIISSGVLSVATINNGGVSGNLGSATNAAANLVFDGGTLQYTGATASTDRNFTINTNKTATFDISTNNLTVSGASGSTNGALTKIGSGTLILTGANTYTGLTSVSAGTLQLNRTGGTTIPVTNNVSISGTGNLKISSNQTISNLTMTAGTLTIDSGVTLTITGTYSVSGGTINNQGTIKLNGGDASFPGAGVTVNNGTANTLTSLEVASTGTVSLTSSLTVGSALTLTSGTFSVGSANTLSIASGGSITATSGNLASGASGGTVAFNGTGTVSGTVGFYNATLAGSVNFGTASTINNSLTRFSGGTVTTNAPTYATNSTLIYDVSTLIFVARGLEWSTTSGAGYPYNVQIKNGSSIDLGGGAPSIARQIAGTLTIDSGGELSMAATAMTAALTVKGSVSNSGVLTLSSLSGGDLHVEGSFTNSGTFAHNNRTVFFEGGNTQTVTDSSGPQAIPYVSINKSGGTVQLGSNLNTLGPNGGNSIQFTGTTSTLTLNGKTLTLGSTVGTPATGSGFIGDSSASLVLNDGGTGAGGAMGTLAFVSGSQTLGNLTINRTGTNASATIGSDVTVNSGLALTSGDIIMSGTNTLTHNGTPTGTTDVVGTVRRTDITTTARSFGNPNNQISYQIGTAPSEMTVNLVKSAPAGFASAVTRTYTITPTGGSSTFTATLRLHYLDSELNGNLEGGLDFWRFNGTAWNRVPKMLADPVTDNWIQSSAVTAFSPWTLATNLSPTAAKLGAVRAESYAEGVMLAWESGREVDNLGYNIYRELGGTRTRVNRSIVAGSALLVGAGTTLKAGQAYQWFDPQGTAGAAYWLEDIDLNGKHTLNGPYVPLAGTGDGRRLLRAYQQPALLSELNERAQQTQAGSFVSGWAEAGTGAHADRPQVLGSVLAAKEAGQLAAQSVESIEQQWQLAARAAVKIAVKADGWYRVTQAELVAAGLDANAEPQHLQLFVDGQEQPLRVNGDHGLTSIEFYGQALDTPTTDKRIYWLVNGSQPGLRIPAPEKFKTYSTGTAAALPDEATVDDDAAPGKGMGPRPASDASFPYTVERKERLLYFSSLLNGDEENFFGQIINATPVTQTLTVRNLALSSKPQDGRLVVALQGVTAGAHHVRISLNNVALTTLDYDGKEHSKADVVVPAALLHEGDNNVTLAITGTETDVSLVDYVDLTYAHKYSADDNVLRLNSGKGGSLRLDGFTTRNIRVIDVTNPAAVVELNAVPDLIRGAGKAIGTGGYAVRVQAGSNRTLLAFTDDRAAQAAAVFANEPSTWHTDGQTADLLILTTHALSASVAPLKTLRESQGLHVSVVDVEDLQDEFAYGTHTPQAIKDFLQWTTTHWQSAPHYVLFFGDASLDPRNYQGRGDFDLVPTKLIDTSLMETASDEWLGDFDNTGLAGMSFGRIPVHTTQEAALVVNKLVNFAPTDAQQAAVMVSDRNGTNDLNFTAASQAVGALLPEGTSITSINRNDGTADVVRGRIVDGINAGPMVVNYLGHGSTTVWTGDGLLRDTDAAALTNGNRLPLFVMMTCLNGYFQGNGDSLAEALLKSGQGGAVAVWASSGMAVPAEQQTVNQELYRQLFGAGGTRPNLGDAVRNAKSLTQDQDIRRTWILFGDPSMRLR